jgi:hypothetical protein
MQRFWSACLSATVFFVAYSAHADEAFYGTTWDSRTTLLYHLSDQTVQKILPVGWQSAPTAEGVNLQLLFSENIFAKNADGTTGSNERVVTWVLPAKRMDSAEKVALVIGGFISKEKAPGPYGAWSPATSSLIRITTAGPDDQPRIKEAWKFTAESGDTINLEIEYKRGVLSHGKSEAKIFSAVKDGFYRIYRVDQASETIPAASPHLANVKFKATGPALRQVFDGSERLVGVVSVPWFARQIFLPKS